MIGILHNHLSYRFNIVITSSVSGFPASLHLYIAFIQFCVSNSCSVIQMEYIFVTLLLPPFGSYTNIIPNHRYLHQLLKKKDFRI